MRLVGSRKNLRVRVHVELMVTFNATGNSILRGMSPGSVKDTEFRCLKSSGIWPRLHLLTKFD